MLKKTKNRLLLILCSITSCALGIYIILYNLEQNITFFYPPSKITSALLNQEIRIGGIVKPNSISKLKANEIIFTITDHAQEVKIFYRGMLPALFRENQGIVAQGKLSGDLFMANELLTKHDENYMPPEVAQEFKNK